MVWMVIGRQCMSSLEKVGHILHNGGICECKRANTGSSTLMKIQGTVDSLKGGEDNKMVVLSVHSEIQEALLHWKNGDR